MDEVGIKPGFEGFGKWILGHTTMTMVNRYVRLAEADADPTGPVEDAHRQSSPVYNMDLRL